MKDITLQKFLSVSPQYLGMETCWLDLAKFPNLVLSRHSWVAMFHTAAQQPSSYWHQFWQDSRDGWAVV